MGSASVANSLDQPFVCTRCHGRFSGTEADCPTCEDEPLLDLRDDQVRQMLRDLDDEAWRKRAGRITLATIVLTSPILYFLAGHLRIFVALIIWGSGVASVSGALSAKFPPRRVLPE